MANDYTEAALNALKGRQDGRAAEAQSRRKLLNETCPDLKALEVAIARAALAAPESLPELQAQRLTLIGDWLAQRGLGSDWLTPPPSCPLCRDDGWRDGQLCACVRNDAARRMFADAGLAPDGPSFERYDLNIFPADARTAAGAPLREHMARLRDGAVAWADRFPTLPRPNMLFLGRPGLGKSYLMDSIARRVIDRGYWVVRATAFRTNDIFAKALADKADPDPFFDCDLLVIDDLGAEPVLNKVTVSSFFNLFNERNAAGKPWLISTNLTPEGLITRYGERVFSRLTDTRLTQLIEFEGVDLRHRG